VPTQHGLMPIPAPATLELLRGFAWRNDGVGGERVTPTGAAILRHLCSAATDPADQSGRRLLTTGYGAGTRELDGLPNILRASAYSAGEPTRAHVVEVLTFDVDDMTGEEIGVAADVLRGTGGVLDLTLQAAVGKKGRPVTRFEILVDPERADAVAEQVFLETSTLGLRRRAESRDVLARQEGHRMGRRTKTAVRPDGRNTIKLESDEIAEVRGLAKRRAIARSAEGAGDG
jgi:uncharacterized protein (DUF111 family)